MCCDVLVAFSASSSPIFPSRASCAASAARDNGDSGIGPPALRTDAAMPTEPRRPVAPMGLANAANAFMPGEWWECRFASPCALGLRLGPEAVAAPSGSSWLQIASSGCSWSPVGTRGTHADEVAVCGTSDTVDASPAPAVSMVIIGVGSLINGGPSAQKLPSLALCNTKPSGDETRRPALGGVASAVSISAIHLRTLLTDASTVAAGSRSG
mmetsp:Transcript_759/g.2637  ORF Transcript_759/g.2637 Transcript_759/m.2637 type:complete len:212 (-) Transcript_759:605-1240(-)